MILLKNDKLFRSIQLPKGNKIFALSEVRGQGVF